MQLHIYSATGQEAISCQVDQLPVLIGRADWCDIQLPFAIVSSEHLRLIEDHQGNIVLEDLGSTNGTTVNGQPVTRPTLIEHNATIHILDLSIVVDLSRNGKAGFTLAERDTFVRKMVSQAIKKENSNDDLAFFEIIRGPRRGQRILLPDELEDCWIGASPDAHFTLPNDAPTHVAQILRRGDGFVITPSPNTQITIDAQPLSQPHTLRSRTRLTFYETECIFFDPLQEYLDDLDGESPIDPPPTVTAPPVETPPSLPPETNPQPTTPTGLSATEVGLLVMTLVFVISGVVILLVVFNVISI